VHKYFTVLLLNSLVAEFSEQQPYRRSIRTGFPGKRGSSHVCSVTPTLLFNSFVAEGSEQLLYRRSIRIGFPGKRGSSHACSVACARRPCPAWLVLALLVSRLGHAVGMPVALLGTCVGFGSIDGLDLVGARSSTFRIVVNVGVAECNCVSYGVVASFSCPSGSCSSSCPSVSCSLLCLLLLSFRFLLFRLHSVLFCRPRQIGVHRAYSRVKKQIAWSAGRAKCRNNLPQANRKWLALWPNV
jgi:hypothetical protein